ncbi:DUF4132 domain-containing protein [Dactylosporangium sp. NPDC048998]|uniref:DUF4132 domain-containing protein n=1 Tax=Dactylosporangium sp. NPDC048998 TaxID=3363976 RepID=UPI00371E5867
MTGRRDGTTTVAVDEDAFVLPAAWRKLFLPRRGGTAGPPLDVDPERGAELVRTAKGTIEIRLAHPGSDADLVAAAWAYLDDPAAGPPAGAGVVAGLISCHIGWRDTERMTRLADAWVAARGVVFAAESAVRATGLEFGGYWNNGRQVEPRVVRRTGPGWGYFPHWVALAGRVRAHLAIAPDDEWAAAAAMLGQLRRGPAQWRVATSFLLPTRSEWVDADCAALGAGGDHDLGKLLWCSAGTAEQLALAARYVDDWWGARDTAALATVADGVGPAIAPHLVAWFDAENLDAEAQQRVLGTLAHLPTDEAFAALVERLDRKYVPAVALEVARRFPRRALRLLAGADRPAARELLRVHVLANRDVVAGELPSLPGPARERVEAILTVADAVPEAPAEALPPVLVAPPWAQPRKRVKPVVVAGLAFADGPVLRWAPGERQEWAAKRPAHASQWRLDLPVDVAAELQRAGRLPAWDAFVLMTTGPVKVVEPLLAGWRPEMWDSPQWMPPIIARHELGALPAALHLARRQPTTGTELLMPYATGEIAAHMADSLARLRSLRTVAMAWFERHAAYAARALAPAALGPAGAERRAAEEALRLIAARHRDAVLAAGDAYGPAAQAGLEALLDADPLQTLPARIPQLPIWAEPGLLPRILLADRSAALGDGPARNLCTMLALSKPGEVYAGVGLARAACDPASLAEFAWALFRQWQAVGAPPKEAWPLHALRWIGDDETVRRLAPVIRAWPGEGGHTKAVAGLDVLADIGTDLALMHLHGIAQQAKFKGLRDRATQKVAEVAAGLGLTAEQLADRLVPDLGLDADGSLTLDYGPRRFVVGFDEQLRPFVTDGTGARRKDLPKPGARDNEHLATAAYRRFGGLKKDVRTIAADQIRRLEAAMVAQRCWTTAEFRDLIVAHPLLGHIARRLVWTADPSDAASVAFRVAEDRTYADAADETYEPSPSAAIGVAHPVRLGPEAVAAWSAVFADYEILQPFAQLARPVHELDDAERAAADLPRFRGRSVPTTKLLALERRGWRRGAPQDAGVQCWMWRPAPDGRAVVLDLDPGIAVGAVDALPDQEITHIWINDHPAGTWFPRTPTRPFATLDTVTASELLRDLTEVLTR